MDDIAEELALAKEEGFPCPEADELEDALADLVDARTRVGSIALRLRRNARLRHNDHMRRFHEMNQARLDAAQEKQTA